MTLLLLLKLLLAPALVVGSSVAGRRWGPPVAGVLVGLPIVAGPILLITALEHGTRFAARAASGALLGLVSLALFAVVFAWCSRFAGWAVSLAIAWPCTLVADAGLARLALPPGWGLLVAVAAPAAAGRLLPRSAGTPLAAGTTMVWPWWDLPGRAAATAVLVTVVTTVAGAAGPALAGGAGPVPGRDQRGSGLCVGTVRARGHRPAAAGRASRAAGLLGVLLPGSGASRPRRGGHRIQYRRRRHSRGATRLAAAAGRSRS